jgi:REP element-mobilizing transposase RayT
MHMPRNRKLFIHALPVEVSFRTQKGLPLPPNPLIRLLLSSVIARAQSLYSVTICHFVTMANHLHLILIVHDPAAIPDFVAYIKRESAHFINRLLGRRGLTIWTKGYDSSILLDPNKVIQRIVYCLANPARANLVDSINDYPHLSSWRAFISGDSELETVRIARDSISPLPRKTLSLREQLLLANSLKAKGQEESLLRIEPDAWMQCFHSTRNADPHEINQQILQLLLEQEQYWRSKRKKPVIGAHALTLQPMTVEYIPTKHSRRTLCMSSIPQIRIAFIRWAKNLFAEAPRFLKRCITSEWLALMPPGLFAPGGALRANLLPQFVPSANTIIVNA